MLVQIATALLAFASHFRPSLEDYGWEEDGPTKTEYALWGTGRSSSTTNVRYTSWSGTFQRNSWKPVCDNTCKHPNDGDCDDGGFGSEYSACAAGTDCDDCSGGVLPECVEPFWVDAPQGRPESENPPSCAWGHCVTTRPAGTEGFTVEL